ncbi:9993_t:CDS:2, partial [Dentiscutata erythropus]
VPSQSLQLFQPPKTTKTVLVCYCYGENGHFARNCLSEKKPVKEQKSQATQLNNKSKNVSYTDTEYEKYLGDQKEVEQALYNQTPQQQATFEVPELDDPIAVEVLPLQGPAKKVVKKRLLLGISLNQKASEYNIGQKVTPKQQDNAHNLLFRNHAVFATNISEDRQMM